MSDPKVSAAQPQNTSTAAGQPPVWNSLEVAKLIIAPVFLALLGWFLSVMLESYKSVLKDVGVSNEKRLAVYDQVKLGLNDMFKYAAKIPETRAPDEWKEACSALRDIKTKVDQTIYVNLPYLTNDIYVAHGQFEALIFDRTETAPNAPTMGGVWKAYVGLLGAFKCSIQSECQVTFAFPTNRREADPANLCH